MLAVGQHSPLHLEAASELSWLSRCLTLPPGKVGLGYREKARHPEALLKPSMASLLPQSSPVFVESLFLFSSAWKETRLEVRQALL